MQIKNKHFFMVAILLTLFLSCRNSSAVDQTSFELDFSVEVGYFEPLNAPDSYSEIYDHGNAIFGAGLRVREGWTRIGLALNFDYFRKDGEKVYVRHGQIFKSGESVTLQMIPIFLTLTWDYWLNQHWMPHAGVGMNLYFFNQSEDDWHSARGYHALLGSRFLQLQRWAFSFEFLYSWVPDAIGSNHMSLYYNEDDIGGLNFFLRVSYRLPIKGDFSQL